MRDADIGRASSVMHCLLACFDRRHGTWRCHRQTDQI